ncbi:MAG: tetratricopeptide repeat protein [Flavobacteriales bacterium]
MSLLPRIALSVVLLFAATSILAQEDGDEQIAPLEIWTCQASWALGDTMGYEVRFDDHTYENGVIKNRKHSNYGLQVIVLDSTDAGYLLLWKRKIYTVEEITGGLAMDSDMVRLYRDMATLDLRIRTDRNGALQVVENMDAAVDSFLIGIRRLAAEFGDQLDSATMANFNGALDLAANNMDIIRIGLMADVDLFFSPFGLEVLSDSFYTETVSLPNLITDGSTPGIAKIELLYVNDLSYQVDISWVPDEEALKRQILRTVAEMQKRSGTKGKKVKAKEFRDMEIRMTRSEHYIIATVGGWPQRLHAEIVSDVGGTMHREVIRTISTDVFMDQPENELYYEQQIQEHPEVALNYCMRGYHRAIRGDLHGAEEDQTMALSLDPRFVPSLQQRAIVRNEMQDYSAALLDIDAAIAIDSLDADLYDVRTDILGELYRYEEALDCIEISLRLRPSGKDALLDRSRILVRLYRYSEALGTMNALLEESPDDALLLSLRADIHKSFRTAEADSLAHADLDRSLELDPGNYNALFSLANLLIDRAQYSEAVVVLDSILIRWKSDEFAYLNRGYAYVQLGHLDPGIRDLEAALDLSPMNSFAMNNLGWAMHLNGQSKEGLAEIERSITLDPSNSYAHYNKGKVLLTMGRKDEACRSLEQSDSMGFDVAYGPMVKQLLDQHCRP